MLELAHEQPNPKLKGDNGSVLARQTCGQKVRRSVEGLNQEQPKWAQRDADDEVRNRNLMGYY
jgi:hypothetical protein